MAASVAQVTEMSRYFALSFPLILLGQQDVQVSKVQEQ